MSKKPSRVARDEAGGKSFDGFSLPPHAIVVIGVDTLHGPEHPLYCARAVRVANGAEPVDDRMYRSIKARGVLQPIRVRLEHAKTARELVEVVADENVCRRVLDEDEIAEGIQRGVNIGLTLKEMADRYGVSEAKAKRLLARAEGVPAKPPKEKPERVSGRVLSAVAAHMRNGQAAEQQGCTGTDIAALIDVVRGKITLADAPERVRQMFTEVQ
jgi:AraC-like DNA-binding protein